MDRISRRGRAATLLVVALIAVLIPSARADDDLSEQKRSVDARVDALGDDLHEHDAEVRAAAAALAQAEAKLAPAEAALAAARQRVAEAEAVERDARIRLAATEDGARQTLIEYLSAQGHLRAHREAIGAMARAAYMGGDLQRLALVMNARSPEELTSAMTYLGSVNRSERQIVAELGDEQRALASKQAELEAARLRITQERALAEAAVAATVTARDAADAARAEVAQLIAERERVLAGAERLKARIESRLADLKAESDRLAAVIRKRAEAARRAAERAAQRAAEKGKSAVESGGGLLTRPVYGPITSPYGMRYHPILRRYKLHTGTDFGVPTGTAVRSARGGVVLDSYYNTAYGYRVVVDHGYVNGVYLVTTYNHLTRYTVRDGERLTRGEVLGYAGSTGYSTGPHLHFETLENGNFVDPMRWLS